MTALPRPSGSDTLGTSGVFLDQVLDAYADLIEANEAAIAAAALVRGCRASRTAAQSIPNNIATAVDLTAVDTFDTDGLHDPAGANPSRITLGLIGKWEIRCAVGYSANATGVRRAQILLNGGSWSFAQVASAGAGSQTVVAHSDVVVNTAITDYVQVAGLQDSGGALNTTTAFLSAVYLGA